MECRKLTRRFRHEYTEATAARASSLLSPAAKRPTAENDVPCPGQEFYMRTNSQMGSVRVEEEEEEEEEKRRRRRGGIVDG